MKHWKNLFCLLLALALCLSLFPAALAEDAGTIAPAEVPEEGVITAVPPADGTETVYTGKCGANLNWSLDTSTGVLNITGTGDMTDWSMFYNVPWFNYTVREVNLPEGLTSIGNNAFAGKSTFESITIPEGVKRIGVQAFYGNGLKSVEIPSTVTSIDSFAFMFSNELTSVTIPASVIYIGTEAFNGCEKLTAIDVAEENTGFSSEDGVLYYKDKTTLVQCPSGKTGHVSVPASVTTVLYTAFDRGNSVTDIDVAEDNTTYSSLDGVLYNKEQTALILCPRGRTVQATIPASVTMIASKAFHSCYYVGSILFEGSAPTIQEDAFYGKMTAYYPGNDPTWTKEVRQNYGGTITWVPYPNVFTDVAEGKYYYIPVLWAYYHDPRVTSGLSDTTFGPGATCTRGQIVTFLWNAAGKPEPTTTENPFVDVKEGKFYYKAVLWAAEEGITSGKDETHFDPNAGCTRAQVVSFLWRFAGSPEPTLTENPFEDVGTWKYYYKAVLWAAEKKITSGVDDTHFGPDRTCTRGQIVTFLYNYMEG